MDVQYFIVQAGGLGTRLGGLTRNCPKCIVPVNNLPILFHLFQKYPKGKFIIIGDYKFSVLERYLRTFAYADYLLVRAQGKGNAAGVSEALRYVPEDIPFCLIWSDLLLSDSFTFPKEKRPCYVGTTNTFPCSWRFENGKLQKLSTNANGVAGCFLIDDKRRLVSLPSEGSFTVWLAQSGIPLAQMDMMGSHEVGTVEAIRRIDPGDNRCRPYNHMEFTEDRVIKTGLTDEANVLLEREARWYERAVAHGFDEIPEIISYKPLTMSRIRGENIFRADLSEAEREKTIDALVNALDALHRSETAEPDYFGLEEDYYTKTIRRIQSIREAIPFTNQEFIQINGKRCKNVFFFEDLLEKAVRNTLFGAEFGPIHGDCTLTNTMIDADGNIYFIDARGYFGKREFLGDIYYDWAKLYFSIHGRFDWFNIKQFELVIGEESVSYEIQESGWDGLTDYYLARIPNADIMRIQLIHAIVWLSLASHCWEDYDSLCLAFYNGLYLWNEWMDTYGLTGKGEK